MKQTLVSGKVVKTKGPYGMNEVRHEVLGEVTFASTTVQALLNAPDALVDIEAMAFVSN